MEVIAIIKKSQIPGRRIANEEKRNFLKAVAAIGAAETLKIKIKNEAEANRLYKWLKAGFTHTKYGLTRRKIGAESFVFVYREEV